MLNRPAEIWRPNPEELEFPWAAQIPGDPIRTAIFCRRWTAWETMELARRLEMDAEHLYFDAVDRLVSPATWYYASTTGITALPTGVATRKAVEMAADETTELYLIANLNWQAIPGVARTALQGMAWEQVPGYREGERGRVADQPPVRAYRYGNGRVVHLNANLNTYSALVPRDDAIEGLDGATDRCLAIAARAALVAAGRQMTTGVGEAASVLVRMQDDLGRVVMLEEQDADGPRYVRSSAHPCFVDTLPRNAAGRTVGFTSGFEQRAPGAEITNLTISPSRVTAEPAPPWVDMPEGGEIECSASIANAPEGARVQWTVRDISDRVVAQGRSPAQPNASVTLELPRPLTPAHMPDGIGRYGAAGQQMRPLTPAHMPDVAVMDGQVERAYERLRFTTTVPYPYDDFTGLVWSYASGDPVLLQADRICCGQGTGMSDLCHMGGYSRRAPRASTPSARSPPCASSRT